MHGFIALPLFASKIILFNLFTNMEMRKGAIAVGEFWFIWHIIGRYILLVNLKRDGFVELSIDKATLIQKVYVILLLRVEVILILTHSYLIN